MPLIILDLDETLIHSCEEWIGRKHDFIAGNKMIFVRPGARELIQSLGKNYKLAVWTASYGTYIDQVIENIFQTDHELEFIWDRTHCDRISNKNIDYFQKDSRKLLKMGFKQKDFFIIDDRPQYILGNEDCIIPVKPYYGSLKDNELISLRLNFDSLTSKRHP